MTWSRNQTVDLLLKFEKTTQTEKYHLDGVCLWPWMRVKIFFLIINRLEKSSYKTATPVNAKGAYSQIKRGIRALREYSRFSLLKKSDLLLVGANSHRAKFNGVSYNKFFDPIRSLPQFQQLPLIEYSDPSLDAFNAELNWSFPLYSLISKLNVLKPKDAANIKFWEDFEKELLEFLLIETTTISDVSKFVRNLSRTWTNINGMKKTWLKILDRVMPSKIFTLCYYTDVVFALNLAASERNIATIEIQHGPMSPKHLAYGNFESLPDEVVHSKLLPSQFLVWDAFTQEHLNKSFPTKRTDILGLPWFDFIEQHSQLKASSKKIVLYALQPQGELFPDYLVRWIKESHHDHTWFIRLHPRQMNEANLIKSRVSSLLPGINVEFDEATNNPLPVVLNQCYMALTMTSGVIIEAALMGKPIIALDDFALEYYRNEYEAKSLYICTETNKALSWNDLMKITEGYFDIKKINRPNSLKRFKELYS